MKVITIGRSSDNNHIINDLSVSKYNTQIIKTDDGRFVIVDMGSVNGTYVNGQRIVGEHPLRPGDVVKIANVMIDWQMLFPGEVPIPAPRKKSRGGWILSVILGALAAALILGIVMLMLFFRNEKKEDSEQIRNLKKQSTEYQEKVKNADKNNDIKDEDIKGFEKALIEAKKETEKAAAAKAKEEKKLKEAKESAEKYKKDAQANLKAAEDRYNKLEKESKAEAKKLAEEIKAKDGSVEALKKMQDSLQTQLQNEQQKLKDMEAEYNRILQDAEAFAEAMQSGVPHDKICDELHYDYTNKDPKAVLYEMFRAGHGQDIINKVIGLKKQYERLGE